MIKMKEKEEADKKYSHYELVMGDFNDTLRQFKGKFHLIIADPPFAIDYDKQSHWIVRTKGLVEHDLYEDKFTKKEYYEFSDKWISLCMDALSKHGSLYIISGWNNLIQILRVIDERELHMQNHIIFHYDFGVFTTRRYTTSHYHILFITKHKTKYTFNMQKKSKSGKSFYEEDVWYFNGYHRANDPDNIRGHPCQLPIRLLEKIIKISSNENDWIGDIFSGSGGTTLSCRNLNRNVIAFEKKVEYEDTIKKKARFGKVIIPKMLKKKLVDYF